MVDIQRLTALDSVTQHDREKCVKYVKRIMREKF